METKNMPFLKKLLKKIKRDKIVSYKFSKNY